MTHELLKSRRTVGFYLRRLITMDKSFQHIKFNNFNWCIILCLSQTSKQNSGPALSFWVTARYKYVPFVKLLHMRTVIFCSFSLKSGLKTFKKLQHFQFYFENLKHRCKWFWNWKKNQGSRAYFFPYTHLLIWNTAYYVRYNCTFTTHIAMSW